MDKSSIILRVTVPGQCAVVVQKHGKRTFSVTYGLQVKTFPSLMLAIAEYESCVVHALTCNGQFD